MSSGWRGARRGRVGAAATWMGAMGLALVPAEPAAASSPASDPGAPTGKVEPGHPTRAPAMKTHPLDAALVLSPGSTCLDRATVLADLRSWRDEDEIDARIMLRIHGSDTDPHALSFQVWLGDEITVERRFDPAPRECDNLHAVVTLALAIALDDTLAASLGIVPAAEAESGAGASSEVVQIDPGEDDLPALEGPSEFVGVRRRGPALSLTAAGGLFAGLTPRLSAGGLLSFDVRPLDHFDLRLSALATHRPGLPLDEGQVAVTLAAGRFDLCWGTAPLSVRLRLCGGAAGGALISKASGFAESFRRTTPWVAAIGAVDVAVHVAGPLALELRVEGVFPLMRTRLDVRSSSGMLLASQVFPVAGLLVAVGPRVEF